MTIRFKDLVAAHERAKEKVAADNAELKTLAKALRLHQGQLQKTAQAAIGAAVLRGLSEGWIKLDLDRLRREAIGTPARGLDPTETIGDLFDQVLRPASSDQAETANRIVDAASSTGDGLTGAAATFGKTAPTTKDLSSDAIAAKPTACPPEVRRPTFGRPRFGATNPVERKPTS